MDNRAKRIKFLPRRKFPIPSRSDAGRKFSFCFLRGPRPRVLPHMSAVQAEAAASTPPAGELGNVPRLSLIAGPRQWPWCLTTPFSAAKAECCAAEIARFFATEFGIRAMERAFASAPIHSQEYVYGNRPCITIGITALLPRRMGPFLRHIAKKVRISGGFAGRAHRRHRLHTSQTISDAADITASGHATRRSRYSQHRSCDRHPGRRASG